MTLDIEALKPKKGSEIAKLFDAKKLVVADAFGSFPIFNPRHSIDETLGVALYSTDPIRWVLYDSNEEVPRILLFVRGEAYVRPEQFNHKHAEEACNQIRNCYPSPADFHKIVRDYKKLQKLEIGSTRV